MSKVYTMKVRRSFQTKDEDGNDVTKNRWPAIGRKIVNGNGNEVYHFDFMPERMDTGEIEPVHVFAEKGESNEK